MATTEQFYTGDGTTTLFTFPFEYITKDDVKVSLNDVETTAYTYANATTIQMNSAPAVDVRVRIFRSTDVDTLKATFSSGSSIRAKDLNDNFQQNNFAVEEIRNYTWDNEVDTIHSDETWSSSDTKVATTAALDAQFWDQTADTIQSTENFENTDNKIMTAAAIDDRIDFAITNDIATDGTGITVTDDGDGTITLGIAQNTVDFDRIKDSDIITYSEQEQSSVNPSDSNIFTANAAARRFDCLVQTAVPTGSTWETGKMWVQNDSDRTVHIWDGSQWLPIASGGAFTTLPKVVYVDSINGDDSYEAHRLSNPKKTIKSAIDDINADANGDGSIVVVAPGIYGETFPIDIQKNDVAIVGTSLRNCIIHPAIPAADQAGYDVDVPETNELQIMFRVNSGSYFYGLTLQGMKASGTRGGNALDTDTTYGLPTNQGWNFAFYPNAVIKKSPYIQNCTNFSDSQINNVTFTPHVPGEGAAGDLDSGFAGGGLLIDGSTPASNSPLRSMVCDSYTHTALNGPGIFITNNGYCQATSSYSFFNHFHLKCLNGGQANLAASTTDFGNYSLIADGRSTSAIFTAATTATASANDITFTIDAPTAGADWHGSATRPQDNMLVDIGGNTYPVLSAVAAGTGWTVTISRPDPANLSQNLGLQNNVASGASATFYLRSMIASSGHTMEYVGSGTDYRALPENGGVPIEARQKTELNNGKIWVAVTDHKGKFIVGDTFSVDQQTGFIETGSGSFAIPRLIVDLDLNGNNISDSTGNVVIDDTLSMNSNKIVNVTNPTAAQDAATKAYVDALETSLEGGQLDNLYFRQDTGETIESGDTWSSSDASIATTAAIDARVIDLVDDVGGFVPINNENSFPATNPDINDGAGTLISIQEISTSRTPSGGTVTIANGSGSNTVTINNCGTTVLASGYGCIVETTTTLHTYNFHRLTPLATEVSTVASNVTPINTVATNISDVSTVSTNIANVNTVANDLNEATSEIDTVATNIANVNTVGNSISDVNTVAGSISNVNSVGSDITNVNTVAGSISNVNTVATNVTDVNTFANRYRIASSDPTTSLDVGDLVFNTSNNELRVYNGSAWQGGVTATGNLVSKSGDTMTGTLIIDGGRLILGQTDTTGVDGEADDLIVASTGHTGITVRSGSSSNASVYFADQDAVRQGRIEYNHTSDYMRFNTSGTERFRFGASGELGIGGATYGTSGQVLTSQGSGSAPQWADASSTINDLSDATKGSNYLHIDGASGQSTSTKATTVGNGAGYGGPVAEDSTYVGFNTGYYNSSIRNSAFGSGALVGSSGSNGQRNSAFGYYALNVLDGAEENTAVGYSAGSAITSGNYNTFLGSSAGDNVTAGANNVILGKAAGGITTGGLNVIIGANSGSALTTNSSYNVLIGANIKTSTDGNQDYLTIVGYQAGQDITTGGHSNSLFGAGAGDSITTGTFNVCVGRNSGSTLTGGNSNTLIGYAAESKTTAIGTTAVGRDTTGGSGSYNTMVGYGAGRSDSTGGYNLGLGHQPLTSLTNGTNNIGIGRLAARGVTEGDHNILIGYDAGRNKAPNDKNICIGFNSSCGHTASYNIVIGSDAGPSNAQSTGHIYIGRNAAAALNGNGNSNVIIGNGAAQYKYEGGQNTIIGGAAAVSNTGAEKTTAVGYGASSAGGGNNNSTFGYRAGSSLNGSGASNTMLGYQAGDNVTGGSNNIVIGNGADATAAGTSNEITLGNTSITKFRIPGVDFVVEGSAWVNFNGTGTVAIRDSNNVSSITDNGTGDHTVNFTNAMPDTNYIAFGNVIEDTGGFKGDHNLYMYRRTPVVGSVRVNTVNLAGNVADEEYVFVGVIR